MKKYQIRIEAFTYGAEDLQTVNKMFEVEAETDRKACAAARKEIKPFLSSGNKWKTRIIEIKENGF